MKPFVKATGTNRTVYTQLELDIFHEIFAVLKVAARNQDTVDKNEIKPLQQNIFIVL